MRATLTSHLACVAWVCLAQHCVSVTGHHLSALQGVLDVGGQLGLGGAGAKLRVESGGGGMGEAWVSSWQQDS